MEKQTRVDTYLTKEREKERERERTRHKQNVIIVHRSRRKPTCDREKNKQKWLVKLQTKGLIERTKSLRQKRTNEGTTASTEGKLGENRHQLIDRINNNFDVDICCKQQCQFIDRICCGGRRRRRLCRRLDGDICE